MQVSRLLGTVSNTNGAYKALIDLLERSAFMRVELNAMAALLLEKGTFTHAEWQKSIEKEARIYFEECAEAWPELRFEEHAVVVIDPQALAKRSREEGWPA